jgi:PGF-pre-PGF domain-containing protein
MIAGRVFEITAETDDGELVTQFSEPITLTFTVTEEELEEAEVNLEDLRVFYWDEKAGAWIALPTRVDPETGKVTAVTDHFTVFAVMAKPTCPLSATSPVTGPRRHPEAGQPGRGRRL